MSEPKNERPWTYAMYKKLLDEYPFKGDSIAKEFGVSEHNVRDRAYNLEVSIHRDWTPEENSLFERYGSKLKGAMLFLLPDRSPSEIATKVCRS